MYPIAFPLPLIRLDSSSLVLKISPGDGKARDVGDGSAEDEDDDEVENNAVVGEIDEGD